MTEKYDNIGINYNSTRKADPYLSSRFIHLLQPKEDLLYLDIGCGTGNYTKAIAQDKYQFIGIDPSQIMLEKANTSTKENIQWIKGKAENIPLASNSVDGIIASLTLHHWKNLDKGFKELNRVLKTQGRIIIFTSTPKQMQGYWLNHYFPIMLQDSMQQMPSSDKIKTNLSNNNLEIIEIENYSMKDSLEDLFLYAGKNNPELYLNENIRQGISSFSNLANAEEVEIGLHQLSKDIKSGKIKDIIQEYKNNHGDYLFICVRKTNNR